MKFSFTVSLYDQQNKILHNNFFLHLLRGESLCAECSSSHYIVHVAL